MKRSLSLAALLTVVGVLTLTVPTGPSRASSAAAPGPKKLRKARRPVPGRYIVVLRAGVADAEVGAVARQLTRAHGGAVGEVYAPSVKGFLARMSEREAVALGNDPRVEYVEEDARFEFGATQTSAPDGLDRIDQRDLPLTTTYSYNINATGAGVHAYVIDSGIDTNHPEIAGRAFHNADFSGFGAGDCNGHGTAVASIIGGAMTGVAKNVTLHSVRIAGCGGPSSSAILSGINWVRFNRQLPAVANLSIEGGGSSTVDTAVRNMINAGVTVTVIAGNNNTNANNVSPARVTEAITVAASDPTNDFRWGSSNFGTVVDLFAPGVSILVAQPSNQYGFATGTSFAAPFAAGVAAQYLETNPFASPATVQGVLVNNATPNRIFNPGFGTPNRLLFSNFLPNPINDSRFFVRYHYKDFLNREPDAPDDGGWDFWTNQIEQCNDPNFRGPDESVEVCKARKRVDVSRAFWFSTEFLSQQPTLASLQPNTPDYNAEFVRLCYVVYLRRNPNDPPDNDFSGYNWWLGQLNATNDYNHIINAFLLSDEYRRRFGPN